MKKQSIVRILEALLITLIMSFSFANAKEMQPNDVIHFPDKNFEKVVRKEIEKQKGDILYSDISNIDSLSANALEIKSIDGIQYFKSLTDLTLNNNLIIDISVLNNLVSLERLEVGNNKITDISPLKNLKKIITLSLNNNNIKNYSVIYSLPKIQWFKLKKGSAVDIRNYSKLKKITFQIFWEESKGEFENRMIKLDKIRHLKKITFNSEFINKYAEPK